MAPGRHGLQAGLAVLLLLMPLLFVLPAASQGPVLFVPAWDIEDGITPSDAFVADGTSHTLRLRALPSEELPPTSVQANFSAPTLVPGSVQVWYVDGEVEAVAACPNGICPSVAQEALIEYVLQVRTTQPGVHLLLIQLHDEEIGISSTYDLGLLANPVGGVLVTSNEDRMPPVSPSASNAACYDPFLQTPCTLRDALVPLGGDLSTPTNVSLAPGLPLTGTFLQVRLGSPDGGSISAPRLQLLEVAAPIGPPAHLRLDLTDPAHAILGTGAPYATLRAASEAPFGSIFRELSAYDALDSGVSIRLENLQFEANAASDGLASLEYGGNQSFQLTLRNAILNATDRPDLTILEVVNGVGSLDQNVSLSLEGIQLTGGARLVNAIGTGFLNLTHGELPTLLRGVCNAIELKTNQPGLATPELRILGSVQQPIRFEDQDCLGAPLFVSTNMIQATDHARTELRHVQANRTPILVEGGATSPNSAASDSTDGYFLKANTGTLHLQDVLVDGHEGGIQHLSGDVIITDLALRNITRDGLVLRAHHTEGHGPWNATLERVSISGPGADFFRGTGLYVSDHNLEASDLHVQDGYLGVVLVDREDQLPEEFATLQGSVERVSYAFQATSRNHTDVSQLQVQQTSDSSPAIDFFAQEDGYVRGFGTDPIEGLPPAPYIPYFEPRTGDLHAPYPVNGTTPDQLANISVRLHRASQCSNAQSLLEPVTDWIPSSAFRTDVYENLTVVTFSGLSPNHAYAGLARLADPNIPGGFLYSESGSCSLQPNYDWGIPVDSSNATAMRVAFPLDPLQSHGGPSLPLSFIGTVRGVENLTIEVYSTGEEPEVLTACAALPCTFSHTLQNVLEISDLSQDIPVLGAEGSSALPLNFYRGVEVVVSGNRTMADESPAPYVVRLGHASNYDDLDYVPPPEGEDRASDVWSEPTYLSQLDLAPNPVVQPNQVEGRLVVEFLGHTNVTSASIGVPSGLRFDPDSISEDCSIGTPEVPGPIAESLDCNLTTSMTLEFRLNTTVAGSYPIEYVVQSEDAAPQAASTSGQTFLLVANPPPSGGGGGGGGGAAPASGPVAPVAPAEPSAEPVTESPAEGVGEGTGDAGVGTGAADSGTGPTSSGFQVRILKSDGTPLGPRDPVSSPVTITSPLFEEGEQVWVLTQDDPQEASAPSGFSLSQARTIRSTAASWTFDPAGLGNGVYNLAVLSLQGQVLHQQALLVDQVLITVDQLTGVLVATSAMALGAVLSQVLTQSLVDAGKEAVITVGEDRIRTRTTRRKERWDGLAGRSFFVAVATLAILSLAFSVEGLTYLGLLPYLDNFLAIAPAVVLVFGLAFVVELSLCRIAAIQTRVRFLLAGMASLALSSLIWKLPFGYPGFIEDRPRPGTDDLEPPMEGLRAMAIVWAPLMLLTPAALLRWDYFDLSVNVIDIIAVEILVAGLPFAPLPGAALWEWRKSWSLGFNVLNLGWFVWTQLGTIPFPAYVVATCVGAVVLTMATVSLRKRLEPEAFAYRSTLALLSIPLPGPFHRGAAALAHGTDAVLAQVSRFIGWVVSPIVEWIAQRRRARANLGGSAMPPRPPA